MGYREAYGPANDKGEHAVHDKLEFPNSEDVLVWMMAYVVSLHLICTSNMHVTYT
jgi:hypothetical protein